MNAQDQTQVQQQQQTPANSRNYSIVGLLPEPLTFTYTDGTIYDVRTPEMFDIEETDQLERIQREIYAAQREFNRAKQSQNQKAQMQVAARMGQQLELCIKMIMPELPESHLRRIPLNEKLGIVTWWGEEIKAHRANQGEAQAHQEPNRSNRRRNRHRQR